MNLQTESQNKTILEHLQAGKGISSLLAFKSFGITRLSGRIYDLRHGKYDGKCHPISGKMVSHGNKRFALYELKEIES